MEEKMNNLREFDERYEGTVLGIDEAGRGPLAGSVVAGAVIIPEYFSELDEINDSKKLTEKKREKLFEIIMEKCIVGIGISDEKEIDEVNILNATFSAMRKAIDRITEKAEFDVVLVDGNHKIKGYKGKQEEIIKGDATSLSIAAASIVAKVTRDRMMVEIDREFPEYKFAKHKGYGTKLHREILLEKGPCKYHRKSFLKKILRNEDQNEMSKEKNSKRKSGNKVDDSRGLKLF